MSYAFNGVYWREALELLFELRQLTMEETPQSIYVYKKFKDLGPRDLKAKPIDIQKSLNASDRTKNNDSLSLNERIKISGISGNQNGLLAIVNFNGVNQIWSVGKNIDGKHVISDIRPGSLMLKNESTGMEEKITF